MGNFLSCYNFYITICFVLWWRLNLKLHVLPTFCVTRKFFEFYNTVVDMLRFRFFSSTLFSRLFLWSTRNALQQKALLLWSIMGMPGKQAAALFPVNFKVVFCFCFFFFVNVFAYTPSAYSLVDALLWEIIEKLLSFNLIKIRSL